MRTSPPKPVALNDLLRQTTALQSELAASVNRVLASGWYILGRECAAFESEFAAYCGVSHCVSVANGTDALEIALRSLGIGPGDSVATVANAGGYSTTAIRAVGAEPLYIDIDPYTMNMSAARSVRPPDPGRARRHRDPSLRTHGGPARAARRHRPRRQCRWWKIARRRTAPRSAAGRPEVGERWPASASTPPRTWERSATAAPSPPTTQHLAQRVKSLRQYGWSGKYQCAEYGRNSRMDEMQAAILRAKLPHLDGWNARRREIAAIYSAALAGQPVEYPLDFGEAYVAHLYVIRTQARDQVRAALQAVRHRDGYPLPRAGSSAGGGTRNACGGRRTAAGDRAGGSRDPDAALLCRTRGRRNIRRRGRATSPRAGGPRWLTEAFSNTKRPSSKAPRWAREPASGRSPTSCPAP